MKKNTKELVRKYFLECVQETLKRVKGDKGDHRPFHSRLLSDEIIKFSKFERSFSTSFGQKVIEQVSKIIAIDVAGTSDTETQKISNILLSKNNAKSIEDHISSLRHNTLGRKPDWKSDLKILSQNNGTIEFRIISDLFFKRDGINHYFSIKTVKPNIDQTSEAKRDLLKVLASDSKAKVYFAIPYNPYGEKKTEYAHSPPFKIFNMTSDSCVLIGLEYWDFIGGKGTYNQLLQIAEEVGNETKNILKKI